jgi:nucleolar MIF4G domain-containing protein 1
MAYANKRKKSSTTELPASLREELGLGDGGQAQRDVRGGRQMNIRRGVIGRKDARKAERRDKKASKQRVVPPSKSQPSPRQQMNRSANRQMAALLTPPDRVSSNKGKGRETDQPRRALKEKDVESIKPAERGQRKHVGQGEATPLQRLMNRNASSSRSEVEPLRKKQKRVPLRAVEQQEEDEIAWLEAHLGHKKAESRKRTNVTKERDETEESEGVDGGEDGLDDLLGDLDRFYPGMYDGANDSDEEESQDSESLDESEMDAESEEAVSISDEEEDLLSEMEEVDSDMGDDKEGSPISTPVPPLEAKEVAITGRYVPPALRQKAAGATSTDTAEMQKLQRQAKGLLNRLGEGNLESIVMEMMESLYHQYSRANVTEMLTTLIMQTVTSSSNLVDTFVILYAALVASLHRLVGLEFGAHFLQSIVESWQNLYHDAREKQMKDREGVEDIGKEAKNLILLLANMYNLGVVACPLIFDVIKVILGVEEGKPTRAMTEIDVELLLRIVKTSGSQLRHDDSTSLKTIVQLAQQSSELVSAKALSSRSKFMLEALKDVKNTRNKSSANQGLEQQSITRMKKYLVGLSKRRTVRTQEPLRVGLKDLQDVDKRGKWWLVGAAWAGYDSKAKEILQEPKGQNKKDESAFDKGDEEAKRLALVQIARQHGMNTAIRQDIFIILMSSQDYLDALEKLQSLKFKKESQRREVIRVLLHCIGGEVNFNPYYVILASRLAIDDIGTKYTLQYCLWDFLRDLGEKGVGGRSIVERDEDASDEEDRMSSGAVSEERIANVARAYGWWIAKGSLSLSAMRVIDFTTLKSRGILFLQQLLIHILLSAQSFSPTLTLRLAPPKEKLDGLYQSRLKDVDVDQSTREAIEGVFVKGTLSNVNLCQGLLFFFERNLKLKDCMKLATSLGATSHTQKQLMWARGVAKQVAKIGAHSSSNVDV